jgi:hypothetical protein
VLVLLVFGGLIGFGWAAALGAGDDVSAWRHVSAAGPMALFLLVSAAVAALFSSFGLKHRQAGFAAFGVCVFLAFGPMIHLGCQEAISSAGAPVRSTLWSLHYLSPIIAAASAWSGGAGPSPWDVIALPGGAPAAAALTVPLWEVSVLALGGLAAIIWTVAIIRIRRAQLRWRQEIAGASVTAPDAGRPADPGGAPAGGA